MKERTDTQQRVCTAGAPLTLWGQQRQLFTHILRRPIYEASVPNNEFGDLG